jgi:hypothetical protein
MLTIFSFGYWGWGRKVDQLVKMVDESEAQAGFHPPVWVDVRRRREVRAPGFRGDTFKTFVGADRYVWMQELGNAAIDTDQPRSVNLNDPKAVGRLLALAVDKANEKRRLLILLCLPPPPLRSY